jgi:hypothetical protein
MAAAKSSKDSKALVVTGTAAMKGHAKKINAAIQKSVDGVLDTGRCLTAAKGRLQHGDFTDLVKHLTPLSVSTAQRLMKVSDSPLLANPAHVQHLPSSWGTLYELTKLKE